MNLLITLLLAALVGWLASKVMNTDAEMGAVANIIAGIVGGLIGTALFGFLVPATPTDNGLSLGGIVVGVVGASIAIAIWRAISGRR
jgi:uncharacterized membrane protein YeaQ/YmgE (transglycosylase-associated protein family)